MILNMSVNTDTQGRSRAVRALFLGRRLPLR